jgi:hypothetical protein
MMDGNKRDGIEDLKRMINKYCMEDCQVEWDEDCDTTTCAADHFRWLIRIIERGEPTFTLRAQDKVAPAAVRYWADMAEFEGAPSKKLEGALNVEAAMHDWQARNGCKVPD